MKSPTTIAARRASATLAADREPLKNSADARRADCVRPPDEREADPETLPASAIKLSGGASDTDVSDLGPHKPCRVRIVNVGCGRVAVAHAAGAPVAELGPSSYVEVVLDATALVLVRAVLLVTLAVLLVGCEGADKHSSEGMMGLAVGVVVIVCLVIVIRRLGSVVTRLREMAHDGRYHHRESVTQRQALMNALKEHTTAITSLDIAALAAPSTVAALIRSLASTPSPSLAITRVELEQLFAMTPKTKGPPCVIVKQAVDAGGFRNRS